MNNTKRKILLKSLKLFNNYGISNVSLRAIADETKISVGNLQYHFKKREDIIEALYFQLVEKIDSIYFINTDDLLQSFFKVSEKMMTLLFEYHFFFLDFITITRNNENVKNHYAKLSKRRELEFLQVVDVLIELNIFRKELLKNEYHGLFKRMEVITNFWFSSTLIQSDTLSKEVIDEFSLLVSQSFYPYLTDEAKKQFAAIFPSQFV